METTDQKKADLKGPIINVVTPESFAAVVDRDAVIFHAELSETSRGEALPAINAYSDITAMSKDGLLVRYRERLYSGYYAFMDREDSKERIKLRRAEVDEFIRELQALGFSKPLDGVISYD